MSWLARSLLELSSNGLLDCARRFKPAPEHDRMKGFLDHVVLVRSSPYAFVRTVRIAASAFSGIARKIDGYG